MPVGFLPPFDRFQGSNLPYAVLLAAQLAIVLAMAWFSWRVQTASFPARRRAGVVLAWIGGIYMAGSLGRLAVGLLASAPPPWFTAWVSGIFHVVLAAYVLVLSVYHMTGKTGKPGGEGA
jgi:hypothetical protein